MLNRLLYGEVMIRKLFYIREFAQARIILYFILLVMTVIMIFFDPFEYICNQPGLQCPFCGIKTGLYLFIRGQYRAAYNANKFVPIIVALGLIFAVDGVMCVRSMSNNG